MEIKSESVIIIEESEEEMKKKNKKGDIVVTCPHCNEPVLIEQLNCRIFRHGQFKSDFKQVNPHLSKDACLRLLEEDKVNGCMGPFKVIDAIEEKDGKREMIWKAIVCDYI